MNAAALAGTRAVGLDIGGTKTHGVVLGEDGSILAQVRKSTKPGADGVVGTAAKVYEALRNGAHFPWDFQPLRRASERYMRNHMDLNVLEEAQRFPRGE